MTMEKMRAFKDTYSQSSSGMFDAIQSIAEESSGRSHRDFSIEDGYSSPEVSEFEDPLTDVDSYVSKYANEVAMTSSHETATDTGTETDGFNTDYGF